MRSHKKQIEIRTNKTALVITFLIVFVILLVVFTSIIVCAGYLIAIIFKFTLFEGSVLSLGVSFIILFFIKMFNFHLED